MRKRNAVAFIAVAVFVIISLLTVSVFATSEDFLAKAAAITGEGSYSERKAAFDGAIGAYSALNTDERESVKEAYARVESEGAALLLIEQRAEAFLNKVATLGDCSSIMDKVEILKEAKDPSVYFDDVSYPGVREAIAELERIQTVKDKTVEFIITVDELHAERELTATVAENYTALKAIILRAEAVYSYVDMGYSGARSASLDYSAIRGEILAAEKHTNGILSLIELIDSKPDYRSKKAQITSLERAIRSENFVAELDSAKAAVSALERLNKYFTECETSAQSYILAVDAIGTAESRFEAIASAMELRLQLDGTVNGVSSADGKLEAIRLEYNASVTLINSVLLGVPVN